MAKKVIKEYGGKEKYASKSSMAKGSKMMGKGMKKGSCKK